MQAEFVIVSGPAVVPLEPAISHRHYTGTSTVALWPMVETTMCGPIYFQQGTSPQKRRGSIRKHITFPIIVMRYG